MSPAEKAFQARLRREARRLGPELARRYLEAYELVRRALTERELVQAIRSGAVDRIIYELASGDAMDPAFQRLRLRLDRALLDAAARESGALPSWLKPQAFNILNPRVVEAARSFDGLAIRTLHGEMQDTMRQVVVRGIQEGKNPRWIARQVLGSVGLSPFQETAVARFRVQLETGDRAALRRVLGKGVIQQPDGTRIVRSGHAGGEGLTKAQLRMLARNLGDKPLDPATVDGMVDAYRKRLLALNTEAHAKTAALQAQKHGQRQSWLDAIDRGVVQRTDLRRRWFTTLDGRERPEHHRLHNTTVGFDEPFPNGEMVPGESTWNCRCLSRVFVARAALSRAA